MEWLESYSNYLEVDPDRLPHLLEAHKPLRDFLLKALNSDRLATYAHLAASGIDPTYRAELAAEVRKLEHFMQILETKLEYFDE